MVTTTERGGDAGAVARREAVLGSMLADEPEVIPPAVNKSRGRPRSGRYPPKGTRSALPNNRAGAIATMEEADVVSGVVVGSDGLAADAILPIAFSRREGLGLVFEQGVTFDQWAYDVQRLLAAERMIPWLIADALAYGEDVFSEDWSQVADGSIYAYQTLANMAYVARKIPNARRRPFVPFTVHAAVAGLDIEEQERLLTRAEQEGITREEMRIEVRRSRIESERRLAEMLPDPGALPMDRVTLFAADAMDTRMTAGCVDAIITSPPYGFDQEGKAPKYRVPDTEDGWQPLMDGFLVEAWRVLKEGGRLIVNLPLDTTRNGYRPLSAQFTAMALAKGFTYATTIVWHDTQLGKSVARGSVDSPSAIRVTAPVEHILVFSKGEWARPTDGLTTDLTHEEWVEWTNGYWQFPGETEGYEGFQAAFPTELPRRLIKLFTFREDIILDPFLGSGTTALVAWRLGRDVYGCDTDPVQVASSKRRILEAARGPSGRKGG